MQHDFNSKMTSITSKEKHFSPFYLFIYFYEQVGPKFLVERIDLSKQAFTWSIWEVNPTLKDSSPPL